MMKGYMSGTKGSRCACEQCLSDYTNTLATTCVIEVSHHTPKAMEVYRVPEFTNRVTYLCGRHWKQFKNTYANKDWVVLPNVDREGVTMTVLCTYSIKEE